MIEPSVEDLLPAAQERAVVADDGRWTLLPPGTFPVRVSGLVAGQTVTLVPASAYVDASLLADDRGRALALINARLAQLRITDPNLRAILDGVNFAAEQATPVLDILRQFSRGRA